MTELGNRFSNVRDEFDNYKAPKGTQSTTVSLDLKDYYYEDIKNSLLPNGEMIASFTARPMANFFTQNMVASYYDDDGTVYNIQDTIYGKPVYESTYTGGKTAFTQLFNSNWVFNSPIVNKAYLNFFIKDMGGRTLGFNIDYAEHNDGGGNNSGPSITKYFKNDDAQLVSIPINTIDSNIGKNTSVENHQYFSVHVSDKSDWNSMKNKLGKAYAFSLTLVSQSEATEFSDYLKVGI